MRFGRAVVQLLARRTRVIGYLVRYLVTLRVHTHTGVYKHRPLSAVNVLECSIIVFVCSIYSIGPILV